MILAIGLYTPGGVPLNSFIVESLLLQAWFMKIEKLNGPGWSLSAEAFFYLLFPFLLYYFNKMKVNKIYFVIAFIWVLSMVYYFLFWGHNTLNTNYLLTFTNLQSPLLQINNFLIGMFAGFAFIYGQPSFIRKNPLLWLSLTVIILLLIFTLPNPLVENGEGGLLSPFFAILILSIAYDTSRLAEVLSNKFFVFLGDISYGIYILQIPLGFWFKGILIKLNINDKKMYFGYSNILFLILTASAIYLLFEKPMRRLINGTQQNIR
jgi:peptidoglycan/LPS O-acetylase OafA/YrhL